VVASLSVEPVDAIPAWIADYVTPERWAEVVAYYRRLLRDPSQAESWAELHVHADEMVREAREGPRPTPPKPPAPPKLIREERRLQNKKEWAERYERLPGKRALR
jgi:hypothetical protein